MIGKEAEMTRNSNLSQVIRIALSLSDVYLGVLTF
jgi:hypothetical protein